MKFFLLFCQDMYRTTQDESALSRVRTLREMGEKFDSVISFLVGENNDELLQQQKPLETMTFNSQQQQQQPKPKQRWDPCLMSLREHFQLSPRFYDTCDRHVSVNVYAWQQHPLVAEYHRRPQLWMSPHLLADVRKKINAGSKKSKRKW